jgi:hypothetical protein
MTKKTKKTKTNDAFATRIGKADSARNIKDFEENIARVERKIKELEALRADWIARQVRAKTNHELGNYDANLYHYILNTDL